MFLANLFPWLHHHSAILEKSASDNCQQIIENVLSGVSDFVGEAEQSDDITLLVLKKLA